MNLLKDNLTDSELICLSHQMPRAKLQKFLGATDKEFNQLVKDLGLTTPTEWLHSLPIKDIRAMVADFRSRAEMATHFSVSVSFINTLCADSLLHTPHCLGLAEVAPATDEAWFAEFYRLGSAELISRLYGLPMKVVRTKMQQLAITHTMLREKHQNSFEASKGRKAELQFAKFRGANITQDLNVTCPQADYDFDDVVLGRVNVKSSAVTRLNDRTPVHKISLNSIGKCDTVAVMLYGDTYSEFLGWFVVRAADLAAFANGRSTVQFRFTQIAPQLAYDAHGYAGIPMLTGDRLGFGAEGIQEGD